MTFVNDTQTIGAEQNAYKNTAKALTTPFEYQGYAMTKSEPNISNHGAKTGIIGRKNELIAIVESAKEPRKYNGQASSG